MKPNIYVDLSGEPDGWRMRVDKEGLDKFLWWSNAFKKVVFGTDVTSDKIEKILTEDKRRYMDLNLDQETKDFIFSGNIKKLLNVK